LRRGHVWGRWHVSADFRRDVPSNTGFWRIYAPGTYQNAAMFGGRLYRGVAGRYLFRVHLAVSRLRPGRYELEARVADIRGNRSTTTWPLQMAELRAR